jgi:hypothetical protein
VEQEKSVAQTHTILGDSIVRSYMEYQRAKAIRALVIGWMTLATLTDLLVATLLVWFLVRFTFTDVFQLWR